MVCIYPSLDIDLAKTNGNSKPTPMSADFSDPQQDDSPRLISNSTESGDNTLQYFQSLLGMIMFVVRTRPDIAVAINRLAVRTSIATAHCSIFIWVASMGTGLCKRHWYSCSLRLFRCIIRYSPRWQVPHGILHRLWFEFWILFCSKCKAKISHTQLNRIRNLLSYRNR